MDIHCKKRSCIYNDSMHCSADDILVGGDLGCKTFMRDKQLSALEATELTSTMFEAGEIEPFTQPKDTRIECRAKSCLFNKQGMCTANGVNILSGKKYPYCATSIIK